MTFAKHRDMFAAVDMQFINSVGPYAVFEVTGPNPHLEGPAVEWDWQPNRYAMLCGATGYYTKSGPGPASASIIDPAHALEYVGSVLTATEDGACLAPADDFGNPIPPPGESPPAETPPGEEPPPLLPPEEPPTKPPTQPPGDSPPPESKPPVYTGLVPPPPAEEVPVLKSAGIDVTVEGAGVGSVVLLRRIAIGIEQVHNNSYVIPSICCQGTSCTLQP
jgi:hypothetical protein